MLRGFTLPCQASNIKVFETEVRHLSISSLIKEYDNYSEREKWTELKIAVTLIPRHKYLCSYFNLLKK